MSDFFNDNETNENTQDTALEDSLDNEESTVFSDPNAKNDSKPIKKKKLLPKIIACLLAFCVLLGGTLLAKKLIPEKKEEETKQKTEDITVVDTKEEDVSFVEISNKSCSVKLNATAQKGDSSDGSDTTQTTVLWTLEGIESEKTNSYLISSTAKSVYSVSAKQKITSKSEELCELDDPVATAKITKTDGSSFTVSLGGDSPDGSGCYLKTSLTDEIFLVDSEIKETLSFDIMTFASSDNIPSVSALSDIEDYYTDGTLSKFDHITLTGKNYPDSLKIVANDDESLVDALSYKTVAPEERFADKIENLMTPFQSGIGVSGAYSYDTSATELAKFGLNSPDLTMTMGLGTQILTYSFKLQDDGSYAAWCNIGKLIYKVDASVCEAYVNGHPTDYYSPLVCLYSINSISSLDINTPEKSYSFSVAKNPDEDAEENYIIGYGGNNIDCQSFQNLYQQIVSLSCYDFTAGATSAEDKVNIIFNFSEGKVQNVEFSKNGESKYQCSINGKTVGQISASALKKVIKNTEKLANGEKLK